MDAIEKVCEKIRSSHADLIIHLGDVTDDADVMEAILDREVRRVPGNCDYAFGNPHEIIFETGGCKLLAVHGHAHGVKRGLSRLADEAVRKGANIALYGHTHVAKEETLGGVHLFNPGSAALPKEGQKKSMAFLEIGENGVFFDIVRL